MKTALRICLAFSLVVGNVSAQDDAPVVFSDPPTPPGPAAPSGNPGNLSLDRGGATDPTDAARTSAAPRPAPQPRLVFEIPPSTDRPEVRALTRLDDSHAFFLNQRGQICVAKFSPGLSLIGWEHYSSLAWEALPALGLGPGHSVVVASARELTQAFDTIGDGQLDFFQALARDWLGRDDGIDITAGPVADRYGRLLYALAPRSYEDGAEPAARIYAWHPDSTEPVPLTESRLPISAFAVGRDDTLAALLDFPGYDQGYYISLTDLPPFQPTEADEFPDPLPQTQPSLLVPASLTAQAPLDHLLFFHEDGEEKLLASAHGSGSIVEIRPRRPGSLWQGGIVLRDRVPFSIRSIAEMAPGLLLAGGNAGFHRLESDPESFRITGIELASDALVLHFSEEVDRERAIRPDHYQLRATSLDGGATAVRVDPILEREGRTIVLKGAEFPTRTVLRVTCSDLVSADGKPLLSDTAFYVINE